jgi:hypothetical protein
MKYLSSYFRLFYLELISKVKLKTLLIISNN